MPEELQGIVGTREEAVTSSRVATLSLISSVVVTSVQVQLLFL